MLVAFDGVSSLESSSSINYYVVPRDRCQDIVYVKAQRCIENVYTGDCKHFNNRSSRNFLLQNDGHTRGTETPILARFCCVRLHSSVWV